MANWKPGDTIDSPVSKMVEIDPAQAAPRDMYKLIIGAVVPRPIAFISTMDESGVGNLAPYSFFNGVSSNPPCLAFSVGVPRPGAEKDTLRNVQETGEFVVNSANEWMIEAVVHCAADFPSETDEMESVGLTPLPSKLVRPRRVRESAVQLECKLHKAVPIGDGSPGSSTLVIGEIVLAHVSKHCYSDGRIDFEKYRAIGRLGGFGYGKVGEIFEIEVPKVTEKK